MLRTNPFRTDLPQYQRSVSIAIPPTDDTRLIAQAAIKLLRAIYRPGFSYQKTGILLTDLVSSTIASPTSLKMLPIRLAPRP